MVPGMHLQNGMYTASLFLHPQYLPADVRTTLHYGLPQSWQTPAAGLSTETPAAAASLDTTATPMFVCLRRRFYNPPPGLRQPILQSGSYGAIHQAHFDARAAQDTKRAVGDAVQVPRFVLRLKTALCSSAFIFTRSCHRAALEQILKDLY